MKIEGKIGDLVGNKISKIMKDASDVVKANEDKVKIYHELESNKVEAKIHSLLK